MTAESFPINIYGQSGMGNKIKYEYKNIFDNQHAPETLDMFTCMDAVM